jgi:hypothetical protein
MVFGMNVERTPESEFPSTLEHKHGLSEWSPMLPERSAETIEPGQPPTELLYRCQRIGCDAQVRIRAGEIRSPAATSASASR